MEAGQLVVDLCFGPRTQEALITWAVALDSLDSRVCELRTQTQSIELEPKGNNAWARLAGPFPKDCGRLTITSLEKRDEGSSTKWKLTEQLLYTNKSETGQECSTMQEETRIYDEGQYDEKVSLPCDFIAVDWMAKQFRQYKFPYQF